MASNKTLHLGYSSFNTLIAELSCKSSVSHYTHLNLRHSALGQLPAPKFTRLLRLLAQCNTIKDIDFRSNYLGDAGIRRIASALLAPSRTKQVDLESINFWDNGVTHKGTKPLGLALHNNTSLKCLNLGRNGLENAGILALVVNNKIGVVEHLNVRDAYVGDEGARVLAAVNTIQSLNLSRNDISDAGCDALLFGERSLAPFHTLNLSSNVIQHVPRIIQATQVEENVHKEKGKEQDMASTCASGSGSASASGSATSLLPENLSLTNQDGSGRAKVERINHCWVNDTGRGQRLRAEDPFGWEAR